MNELVSIIVPVYNVGQYLEKCVDSLVTQTYDNLQIVLVDDGSTDGCDAICDRFAAKDLRVTVVHKRNGGTSSAREAGMNKVYGKYVMFVDGDDWLETNTVEQCINSITEDPDTDCVLFSYMKEARNNRTTMHIYDENEVFIGSNAEDRVHRRIFGLVGDELLHPERMENIASCGMKLYKVEIANKGKYYDTKDVGSCEDGLFNIYALAGCRKIKYIDEPMYHYRKHEQSLTKHFRPGFADKWRMLFSVMQKYIDENECGERYKEALKNRIALSITAVARNELRNKESSTAEKIKNIKEYLQRDYYCEAVRTFNVSQMPMKWKMLMYCAKRRASFLVYAVAWLSRRKAK